MANWCFYIGEREGERASYLVDLDPSDPIADALPPRCVRIEVDMLEPLESGLGSKAEAERMAWVDDAAEEMPGLRQVARVRSNGVWHYLMYGPTAAAFEPIVGRLRQTFGNDVVRHRVVNDPKGELYRRVLPNRRQRRFIEDCHVCNVLADHGDDARQPRRIDHWCNFPTDEARDRFTRWAKAEGFAIDGDSYSDGLTLPFGLQLYRTDAADVWSIHAVTTALMDAVAEPEIDGEYDGWETFVVKPT